MTIDPNSSPGSAFVQITIGQVYSEVTGTRQELRDLAHSVHAAVGQLSDHEVRIRTIEHDGATSQELEELRKEFGARVTVLERWRWGAAGAIAVVGGGSGLLAYLMHAR